MPRIIRFAAISARIAVIAVTAVASVVLSASRAHAQPATVAEARTIAAQPGASLADLVRPGDTALVITPADPGHPETESRNAAAWVFAAVRASDACVRVTSRQVRQAIRADGTWIDAEVHAVVKEVLWARDGVTLAAGNPLSWPHTAGGRASIRNVDVTVGYPFPEKVPADYLLFLKRVNGRWTLTRSVLGLRHELLSSGVEWEGTEDPWLSQRPKNDWIDPRVGLTHDELTRLLDESAAFQSQGSADARCPMPPIREFSWEIPGLQTIHTQLFIPSNAISTETLACVFGALERRVLTEHGEGWTGEFVAFDNEQAAKRLVDVDDKLGWSGFLGSLDPLPEQYVEPVHQLLSQLLAGAERNEQLAHARAMTFTTGAPSDLFSLLPFGGLERPDGLRGPEFEVRTFASGARECSHTLEGRCLFKLDRLTTVLDLARAAGSAQLIRLRARLDRQGRMMDVRPDDGEVPARNARPLWDAILRHVRSWRFDPGSDEHDVRLTFDIEAAAADARGLSVDYDLPTVQIWFTN